MAGLATGPGFCSASNPAWDFEAFEQTLHRFFVAAEREALGQELARFDLDAPQVEIDGERYDRVLRCETTYTSAACLASPVS